MTKCPKCENNLAQFDSKGGYHCTNVICEHGVNGTIIKGETHYPAHKDISKRNSHGNGTR